MVQSRRGVLTLKHPMDRGIVTDWDDMIALWRTAFKELWVDPQGQAVMLMEPIHNPVRNTDRTLEIFFEEFGVGAVYLANPGALSVLACGAVTGVAVDVGHGITQITPVYEGHCLHHAAQRLNLGGGDVTRHLATLLCRQGRYLSTTAELELAREIKEQVCYFATDPDTARPLPVDFELPDGQFLPLGPERFQAPDILFRPATCGLDVPGLTATLAKGVGAVDPDAQLPMCGSIVLAGGTSLCNGFAERLRAELERAPLPHPPVIVAAGNRQHAAWTGGSALASSSAGGPLWIPRAAYAEAGASLIRTACF